MALTREQSISKYGTEAYTAWGDVEAAADWAAKGGGAPGAPGAPGGATDYTSLARQMLQMRQEAAQPAIESLRAGIPEIEAKYGQKEEYLRGKEPLMQERYKTLIEDIRGYEERETERAEIGLEREWGRRGLSALGGAYEQRLGETLQPISRQYAGLLGEAGISREESSLELANMIAGLTTGETGETRAVRTAMAQLQAGGAGDAITNALQLFQMQQQQAQAEKEREWEKGLFEWEKPFKERMYEYELEKPYYKPETAGRDEWG